MFFDSLSPPGLARVMEYSTFIVVNTTNFLLNHHEIFADYDVSLLDSCLFSLDIIENCVLISDKIIEKALYKAPNVILRTCHKIASVNQLSYPPMVYQYVPLQFMKVLCT